MEINLMKRLLLLLVCLAFVGSIKATTYNAASVSRADVLTAINSATNGDIVIIPAGTANWSSVIDFGTKALKIQGQGIGVTTINNTGTGTGFGGSYAFVFKFTTHATLPTRITGITFNGASDSGYKSALNITSGNGTATFRIDNCRFYSAGGGATFIQSEVQGKGLIDHCIFVSEDPPNEMIHNEGYGGAAATGWAYAVTPGSDDALYVEANTFTFNATGNPAYFWGSSAMQNYYGSRTVFRYNTNTMCQFDNHGTAGNRGGRWYEVYSNSFVTVANADQSEYMALRAGSGAVFGNTRTGPNSGSGSIRLREEDGGSYPQQDQVGRGQNQTLDPLYLWNNSSTFNIYSDSSLIQLNRDYYLSARPSYTPYQYPHPYSFGDQPPPGTNRPPVPVPQSVTVYSNSSLVIVLSASDADSDPLTYSVVVGPTNGNLTGTVPTLTYTPNATYVGADWFSFKANDGTTDSTNSSVTIDVVVPPTGNVYYVDQDHASAADNPTNGAVGSPFLTIDYALTRVGAGSTVYIKESTGVYGIGTGIYIRADTGYPSGTSTQRITLRNYPGQTPMLEGAGDSGRIAFDNVSYWTVEGLNISRLNNMLAIRNGSHNIIVTNCVIHDSGGQLVHVFGNAHDVTFQNNRLYNGGSIGTDNGEAFYIGTHGGGTDQTYNVIIRSNHINGMKHEGIEFKHDTHDCIAEGNVLTNCVANFDFGKWSITTFPTVSYGSNPNHIIRSNIIQSVAAVGTGAAMNIGTGTKVYNNIIYNVTSPAYAFEINSGDSYTRNIWNNTMDVTSSRAINNLGGTSSISNNIGPTTGNNIAFSSGLFVSSATRNYALVAATAAVDTGISLASHFTTDFAGTTRPQGTAFDKGAFELSSGSVPLPNISGTNISSIIGSGALAGATTDAQAYAGVKWGTTTNIVDGTYTNATLQTSHSLPISSLTASTLYYARMYFTGTGGSTNTSLMSFTSAAAIPTNSIIATPPLNVRAIPALP